MKLMNNIKAFYKILFVIILVTSIFNNCVAQKSLKIEDSVILKFYEINKQKLYWFSSARNLGKAIEWVAMMEASKDLGFASNIVQINKILNEYKNANKIDSIFIKETDIQITAAVLNYLKVLHQGDVIFDYDEVNSINDTAYIYQLLSFRKRSSVSKIVKKLDCKDADYLILKKFLTDSLSLNDTINYKTILLAMNYRRYINSTHQSEYIVVNIPATEAEYYKNNKLQLKMRTVVGKTKTPTPTIASYLNNIICFPSWNVPYSIAVKELLPKVQKNENYLEQNSIDVLDAKGNVVEESDLYWNSYTETNFPYYFRQSTGSHNALGVIKFDFQNPFSIFLHATSWQGVFEKENRFLSHGCIRLEKPFELANAILNGELDIEELKKGKENTKSRKIQLSKKIPVYIIYVPVKVTNGSVFFLEDIYHLIK